MPKTETPNTAKPAARAARILTHAVAQRDSSTPFEAAHAAWHHGGPTVAELERRITAQRNTTAA